MNTYTLLFSASMISLAEVYVTFDMCKGVNRGGYNMGAIKKSNIIPMQYKLNIAYCFKKIHLGT